MDDVRKFGVYEAAIGQRANSEKLIISLSGFGPAEGDIPFESVHSFKNVTLHPNLIYVKDNSRSWYTNKDGFDELVLYILDFIKNNQISDVTTFGISMGGYGAAIIAKAINAKRAIALSPRTIIGPKCNFDNRNKIYTDKINNTVFDDMRDLITPGLSLTVIFSIDDPYDSTHASRLMDTSAKVIACRGEHNIARTLKNRHQLDSFLESCITDDLNLAEYGFFSPPPESLILGTNRLVADSVGVTSQLLRSTPDEYVPNYMYKELKELWVERYFKNPPQPYAALDLVSAYPAHPFLVAEGPEVASYLGIGWAGSEHFGVWGDGKYHTIKMRMTSMPPSGLIKLSLSFRIFRAENLPDIERSYFCNGMVPDSQETKDALQIVEFNVSEPFVEISIYTPNAVRPSELGLSNDNRQLSIALLSIKSQPSAR